MSLHVARHFIRPLLLVGAVLVVHIGTASAGDAIGDIPQQMRELLAGTTTSHSSPQSAPRYGKVAIPTADIQEMTRQYLSGKALSVRGVAESKPSEVAGASTKTEPQKRTVVSGDVQADIRQVLLGQPYASHASVTSEAQPQTPPVAYGARPAAR
jgi:hypothetical protein